MSESQDEPADETAGTKEVSVEAVKVTESTPAEQPEADGATESDDSTGEAQG